MFVNSYSPVFCLWSCFLRCFLLIFISSFFPPYVPKFLYFIYLSSISFFIYSFFLPSLLSFLTFLCLPPHHSYHSFIYSILPQEPNVNVSSSPVLLSSPGVSPDYDEEKELGKCSHKFHHVDNDTLNKVYWHYLQLVFNINCSNNFVIAMLLSFQINFNDFFLYMYLFSEYPEVFAILFHRF